jgi:hypothetical protein
VSSLLMTGLVAWSHVLLHRHITRTAEKQTVELQGKGDRGQ